LDHLWSLLNDDAFRPRTRQLYRRLVPFVGYLPEVRDVTANVLRKIRAEVAALHGGAQDGVYQLTLEHLEAPSNNLAFRLMTDSFARRPRLATTVQHVPEPDPRRPCRPVKYLLWTYHDTDPWPAIAPPQGDVAARVAELAAEPYDYEANWASASRLAAELLPTDATSLLAVMVRPPPLPAGEDVLVWLPRVQLVAARVLAHLDGGWRHSIRRETLLSALWGPADWTTVAAIIALAQLAQEMEAAATDIRDAFATLATHQPREAYCCYEYALYCNWLLLPNVPDEERQRLETRVQEIEATWPEAERPQGRRKSPPTRSRQR
jgi:hypothetical protein